MVNSRDIARIAGVSQSSVSRVLSNSANVTPETRRRVREALEATGYAPNALAQAMRTRRTGTIGVVVANVTNPFYPELIGALSTELAAAGRRMILWDSEGPGEESAVEAIRQKLVDGLIFTTATADSVPLREALEQGSPLVLVHRSVEGIPCDQITSDNIGGGRTVAQYFAASGHMEIGLIGGPTSASTAREREQGFRGRLDECGIPLRKEYIRRGDFSHACAYAAMQDLAAETDPPTAVFCVNDLTAFGAVNAARSLSWRVPEDVWVVGFDDIEMASWEVFDLTTVRQPIAEMASVAVAHLISRIEGNRSNAEWRQFPNHFVVRGSTARVPFVEA